MGTCELVSPKRSHDGGTAGDRAGRDLFDSPACLHGALPSTPGGSDLLFACRKGLNSLKLPVCRVQTRI